MPQFAAPLKALYGAYQAKQSSDALRRLANQPEPTYRSADSILQEAEGKTPSGYTGQEKAAFQQSLARLGMQKYRQASQINPNMASNINAGINYGSLAATNEFARNDASLRRDRINRLVTGITNEDNRNVSTAIQNRRMLQEQYGQAYQAGIGNIFNLFDQVDRDAASLTSIVTGMNFKKDASQQGMVTDKAPMLPVTGSNPTQVPTTLTDNRMQMPLNTTVGRSTLSPQQPPPLTPYNQSDWIANPNMYNPYKY